MKIVADIGGTKTRIAGSTDLLGFSDPVIYDTPKKYDEGIAVFVDTAHKIAGNDRIEGIQIGIRGAILREIGSFRDEVLTDWSEKLLCHDIATRCSAHVEIENDMALVGLGEAVFGAGKGSRVMVYITVSTGVGGSRIVDGVIDRSAAYGFSPGGQYLNIDPTITFEEMVSGAAVERQFGKHPKDLGKDHEVWSELARLCAYGVHNSILLWSPDRVVLGGSMFNEIGISVPAVAEHVRSVMKKFPEIPEIVHSSLGDFGGLWGGLALLRQRS